jgi:DnaJ homologue, subfamily C, member 28, conserved domain
MSGLLLLDLLAEARIEDAIASGMLDNLPGAGRPLVIADGLLVPEEVRGAYRILANAGCVPPEVEARRELAALLALLASQDDYAARRPTLANVALLKARLESSRSRPARRGGL